MKMNEPVAFDEAEMSWAFPAVDPGAKPLGARILVQLRRQNMVAKVVAVGPLAFKKRDTMEPWPEGSWCEVGDFIRVPKWGGDRWEVAVTDQPDEDPALFAVFNDHEVIAKVTGDPLSMRAFV
ncbi:MAG: hypothetical protein EBU84_10860 [Actinobacteria bacterium]|nr:hypothetical protein [Actinomycetota bacterium]